MKQGRVLFFLFFLFLLSADSYSQTHSIPPPPSPLGALRTTLIEGDVQIKMVDAEGWVPAAMNVPMKEGDKLWVPEAGKAELQSQTGTYLRCDQKTGLSLLTIKKEAFQYYLSEGRVYLNFDAPKGSFLQMDTPISSIGVYEKAIFRVDVSDKGYTDISVYNGTLYVEGNGGKTTVEAGSILFIREGDDAELAPLGIPDGWEIWNKERDKKLTVKRDSYRYLSEELRVYANELEENGKWVHVGEYGYVWTPTAGISSGWVPYRSGRWVWIGGDYVWVSYEPWGWAPYHYGRWSFIPSVGWFWVPPVRGTVYWGPGYVGWVHTPTYIAWVPLAPEEIYYGYGYFGPHSVNITKIDMRTVNIGVYRNAHISRAVTIVDQSTFLTGRPVDIHIRENPFLKQKIHVGRPLLTPEKLTRMPIIKDIPKFKYPHQRISDIKIDKIRKYRPLVRDKDASAFRPKQPPPKLSVKPRAIEKDRVRGMDFDKDKLRREDFDRDKLVRKDFDKDKLGRTDFGKERPSWKDLEKDKSSRKEVEKVRKKRGMGKASPKQDLKKAPPGQELPKTSPKHDVRKRPPKRDLPKAPPKHDVGKASSRPEEPKVPAKKDLDKITPE